MAVPCPRSGAAQLEWSHVDLDSAEWQQPGHLTKNREPHRLHLNELALEVLRTRWRAIVEPEADRDVGMLASQLAAGAPKSGLVFAAPSSGRVMDTFTAIKATLSKATGPQEDADAHRASIPLTGWTWHDFRRSFATALGEAGVSETMADAILNHRQAATRGGVLGVYQRASRWPELVRAMDLWGKLLAEAITGSEAVANVVPMVARVG